MERIIGPRQCGKTTTAIRLATTENIPILVKTEYDKRSIALHQRGYGDWNPHPLSIYDVLNKDFRGAKSVIVDDADFTLQALLHQYNIGSVRAITMVTTDQVSDDIPSMNFTVNDFISKIDGDEPITIYDSSMMKEVFNNVDECNRDISKIHISLKRRFITKIYFDDLGVINITI